MLVKYTTTTTYISLQFFSFAYERVFKKTNKISTRGTIVTLTDCGLDEKSELELHLKVKTNNSILSPPPLSSLLEESQNKYIFFNLVTNSSVQND